jgi:hypothetical protein
MCVLSDDIKPLIFKPESKLNQSNPVEDFSKYNMPER